MKKLMFLLVACICISAVSGTALGYTYVRCSLKKNLADNGYTIKNINPKGWHWRIGKKNYAFYFKILTRGFDGKKVSFDICGKGGKKVCHVHRKIEWLDLGRKHKKPGAIYMSRDDIKEKGYEFTINGKTAKTKKLYKTRSILSLTISSVVTKLSIFSISRHSWVDDTDDIVGTVKIYKNGEELKSIKFIGNSLKYEEIEDFNPEKDKLKIVVTAYKTEYSLDYGTLKSINYIKVFAYKHDDEDGETSYYAGVLLPRMKQRGGMSFVLDQSLIEKGYAIRDILVKKFSGIIIDKKTKNVVGFRGAYDVLGGCFKPWFTIVAPSDVECHVNGELRRIRGNYEYSAYPDDQMSAQGYAVKYKLLDDVPYKSKRLAVVIYRPEHSGISPTAPL